MYIPNTVPSTLAGMLEFLQPTVQDGLFDSVAYDNADNPTKIVCTQDGNTILEISSPSGYLIYRSPEDTVTVSFVNYGAASGIMFAARCSGGVMILSNTSYGVYVFLIIGKTSAGKTGFLTGTVNDPANLAASVKYTPICYGDDTTLSLAQGYTITSNYAAADRTILSKIPVVGSWGSTDYFTTIFSRNVSQYSNTGVQLIGGKRYGCMYFVAITDDE